MQNTSENKVEFVLIRHGATAGNFEKRYIGRTDESLCDEGIKQLNEREYPKVELVFSSPMKRCLESAALIYPLLEPVVIDNFRETDFGDFEGKNYAELQGDDAYQAWIDSNGELPFPNGESREECDVRILRAFEEVKQLVPAGAKSVAFVVHGGTIMTLMSHIEQGNYYDYQIKNGDYIKVCVTI